MACFNCNDTGSFIVKVKDEDGNVTSEEICQCACVGTAGANKAAPAKKTK